MMPCGSSACLMARIIDSATGDWYFSSLSALSSPTPCSARERAAKLSHGVVRSWWTRLRYHAGRPWVALHGALHVVVQVAIAQVAEVDQAHAGNLALQHRIGVRHKGGDARICTEMSCLMFRPSSAWARECSRGCARLVRLREVSATTASVTQPTSNAFRAAIRSVRGRVLQIRCRNFRAARTRGHRPGPGARKGTRSCGMCCPPGSAQTGPSPQSPSGLRPSCWCAMPSSCTACSIEGTAAQAVSLAAGWGRNFIVRR